MSIMIVRDELPSDIPAIRKVVQTAFARQLEADLVDQLRTDGDVVISLVALDGADLIGHVLFSRMTAPFRALGLAPVSVIPDRQRQGVGSELIRVGVERARCDGWQGIFVVGDPAYYRRFGFDSDRARGFASPYAGPWLMALALDGQLPASRGRVAYAEAFRSIQ
jgi:putative acetyltransferase